MAHATNHRNRRKIQIFLAVQAEKKENLQERETSKASKKVDEIPFDEKLYKLSHWIYGKGDFRKDPFQRLQRRCDRR